MSSFFAFLDDIAVLAKAAAASVDDIAAGAGKAASKCAAVVIDDAAVTPQYVQGISPARELPVVAAIAKRSLINKGIIIVAIMILSAIAPWIFPWALIVGGCYLAYEGAEKIIHRVQHGSKADAAQEIVDRSPKDEKSIIQGAATTDFVLSAEIMLISVDALESGDWWMRLIMLIVVAVLMTLLVYGSVGLLIKVDDAGRWLAERGAEKASSFLQAFGVGLVKLMPKVFALLTVVGVAAMLWVGGHLLIVNLAQVGLPLFATIVHDLTSQISNGFLLWCADTLLSACFGIVVGAVLAGIVMLVKRARNEGEEGSGSI
ncbi:DUF808 domain-containing protein [Raoultibacter phocaeensis]|uniref:DUF808 domain-containing protein n=1 Tax=Raoultibacter phocaeensis TaxID=2479841 RepID=UPI001C57F869|nr:DUF808 family protein [Raoultibacter phocaeensis]